MQVDKSSSVNSHNQAVRHWFKGKEFWAEKDDDGQDYRADQSD